MRATTRLLAVLTGVGVLLLPGVAAQATPTTEGHPAPIRWAPCDEDPTAECGPLTVPVDWSEPHGAQTELALARRPATEPGARIGSLVVNPGGPGGSGVDFALAAAGQFSEDLRERFDIVGFDPRGVARSNPVVCSADLLQQAPPLVPTGQPEFEARIAYNRELAADCRARTGPLFDHVDTLSVVRDLDAIRAALGERKLTYYGLSYGTLIGQQYAEEYPHRVRALALDSNMDHSLGTRGFLRTQSATTQDSFDEFVGWCDGTHECALHGADVRSLWADLFDRAEQGKLVDPADPDRLVSTLELVFTMSAALDGPDWYGLAEQLAAFDTGEPAPATPVSASSTAVDEQAIPLATFCQDWHLPVRDYREFARHMRHSARVAPDLRYSPRALYWTVSCLGWPGEVNNPQHRLRVPPGPELLLTNALHDPATGYNWARNAARQLGRSAVLLTYEGWGHGVYGRSDCVTGTVDDYLTSLALPERGARCPAVAPEPPLSTHRGPVFPPVPRYAAW